MTKLHFPQLDARSLNPARPAQSLRDRPNKNDTPTPPPVQNAGGGKGQKRKGLFP